MNNLSERLAKLSPEQQKLLRQRMEKQGIALPETKPVKSVQQAGIPDITVSDERRAKGMGFSMLFFSGDGTTDRDDKYDFLLDCARYADQNDFTGIWTPERHFQTFGGLFPNPSVLSAALAMVTKRIQIRAGSVVIPMHQPIRLAEEWAVVDNLSKGRAAISLATGWSRSDFTVRPENYHNRREIAFQNLEIIQRLWRGEKVTFAGVDGDEVDVAILPRPIQPQLPVWVTVSGNPHTWITAGEIGANILTAMGRNPDDLKPDIQSYRAAREQHGHDPAEGIVSVMMHTFLGEDENAVRQATRGPLSGYLKTYINQQQAMEQQSAELQPEAISERDQQAMLDFAFERYFSQAALLGTPDKCARMVEWMQAADVDEIACLVDFGVEHEAIHESFTHLSQLCARFLPKTKESLQA